MILYDLFAIHVGSVLRLGHVGDDLRHLQLSLWQMRLFLIYWVGVVGYHLIDRVLLESAKGYVHLRSIYGRI